MNPAPSLSPLQQSVLVIKELRARLDRLEAALPEPIAIVGLGCRLPGGADSPARLWELLCDGVNAVGPVPADRWNAAALYDPDPAAPGKIYAQHGSFLKGIDGFDARFFGISPREAQKMDPQQRLLLEVAWEALEHAGLPAHDLAGQRVGVFVGAMSNDYAQLSFDPELIDIHTGTGTSNSILAGRLSYWFGLRGPALTVDTACSSSLVAVHLACQILRNREADLALAGGVSLMLTSALTLIECRNQMLAPDGRCKTFDASADGFVRGEGSGLVVLKRLSDARRDGDRVLALIAGSAVNHDGRSSGLMVPNPLAQEEVLREALRQSGLPPTAVAYVEAHGTGTPLGDPIEVGALQSVYGPGRAADSPLLLGSLKTNFGHLEGAAGIAGLLKAVLAIQHRQIPPQLHFNRPNPYIDWTAAPVKVVDKLTDWPASPQGRVAGVSSFGFSGTNAHFILTEPPATKPESSSQGSQNVDFEKQVLLISARTEPALRAAAAAHAQLLAAGGAGWAAVCASSQRRSQLAYRLVVMANSSDQALAVLRDFVADVPNFNYQTGKEDATIRLGMVLIATDEPAAVAGAAPGQALLRAALAAFPELVASPADAELAQANPLAQGYDVLLCLDGASARLVCSPMVKTAASDAIELTDFVFDSRNISEVVQLLSRLHVRGVAVRWPALWPNRKLPRVDLPNYPWQRESYWVTPRTNNQPKAYTIESEPLAAAASVATLPDAPLNDEDCYLPQWQPVPMPAASLTPQLPVLLIDALPNGSSDSAFATALASLLGVGQPAEVLRWAGASEALPAAALTVKSIVYVIATAESPSQAAANLAALGAFFARIKTAAFAGAVRIVAAVPAETSREPLADCWATAPLWGLVRAVRAEWPALALSLVEVLGATHERLGAELVGVFSQPSWCGRVGEGGAWQRRLRRQSLANAPANNSLTISSEANAVYLITGGLGSLGLAWAEWLAGRGARHVLLLGRRSFPAPTDWEQLPDGHPAQAVLPRLRRCLALGCTPRVVQADVSDAPALRAVFGQLEAEGLIIKGIIHAAGSFAAGAVEDFEGATQQNQLRPKVQGALVLHELSSGRDLDFLLFCSSAAALFGGSQMTAYAAANAFLDGLARYRTQRGLPATSINWGGWRGSAMLADAAIRDYQNSIGSLAADPVELLQAGYRAVQLRVPQLMLARMDWPRFLAFADPLGEDDFYSELREPNNASSDQPLEIKGYNRPVSAATNGFKADAAAPTPPLLAEIVETAETAATLETILVSALRIAHPRQRKDLLVKMLRAEASEHLGYGDPTQLPLGEPLQELGFDSLMSVSFNKVLTARLGIRFSPTLVFEYPTLNDIADHLLDALSMKELPVQSPVATPLLAHDMETTDSLSLAEMKRLLDQALDVV